MAEPHDRAAFLIKNDYRWPFMGYDGKTYSLFIGDEARLKDLRVPTIGEYIGGRGISSITFRPELRALIEQIDKLAGETNEAARMDDIETVRRNYAELRKFIDNVPCDVNAILEEWKEKGYL